MGFFNRRSIKKLEDRIYILENPYRFKIGQKVY